jgi:hypothetical protein
MVKIISLFILFFITACAVTPLTTGLTGRSLGKGSAELSSAVTGYVPENSNLALFPSVKILYGLMDNLDVGFQTELQSFTFNSRFSIINNQEKGLSLALLGAASVLSGQFSFYLGASLSYLIQNFEPYLIYRYNMASIDRAKVGLSFFKASPDINFQFSSYGLGLKYWLLKEISLGAEGVILGYTTQASFVTPLVFSLQLSFIL